MFCCHKISGIRENGDPGPHFAGKVGTLASSASRLSRECSGPKCRCRTCPTKVKKKPVAMSFITNPDWRTTLRNRTVLKSIAIFATVAPPMAMLYEVRLGSYIALRKPQAKYFCGRDGKSLCVSDHQAELTLSSLQCRQVRSSRAVLLSNY